jgi:hypothetical protein
MMHGWLRQFALTAKVKTGLSGGIAVCWLIALVAFLVTCGFLCVAAFVWLASRYDALTASLILAGVFFLIALIALIAGVLARRSNQKRAQLELAAVRSANLLDPKLLTIGIEIGRAVGWGRIIALGALGIFAAGVSKEWVGRRGKPAADEAPPDA